MKCFNHHDADAMGICKNCNKGLCPACLTDVGDGIACTATCVNEVKLINRFIKRNTRLSRYMIPAVVILVGLFLLTTITKRNIMPTLAMSGVAIASGVIMIFLANRKK